MSTTTEPIPPTPTHQHLDPNPAPNPLVSLSILLQGRLAREISTKFATAPSEERKRQEAAAQAVLNHLQATNIHDETDQAYRPSEVNERLKQREVQLTAVIASYELELAQWEQVGILSKVAEPDAGDTVLSELPGMREEPPTILNAKKALESSTQAVETYILQAEHVQNVVKQMERRNRLTESRVREVAEVLNGRVIEELGASGEGDLVPPSPLAAVETNLLNVLTLTNNIA